MFTIFQFESPSTHLTFCQSFPIHMKQYFMKQIIGTCQIGMRDKSSKQRHSAKNQSLSNSEFDLAQYYFFILK